MTKPDLPAYPLPSNVALNAEYSRLIGKPKPDPRPLIIAAWFDTADEDAQAHVEGRKSDVDCCA